MSHSEALVLCIDDDPCVGRILKLSLKARGCNTVQAVTAEDGLEMIHRLKPTVVITDVSLPGINGIELCRLSESIQKQHPFLIVVLTSVMDTKMKTWVEDSELRRYVSKPFSPRKLTSMICEYVKETRSSAQLSLK